MMCFIMASQKLNLTKTNTKTKTKNENHTFIWLYPPLLLIRPSQPPTRYACTCHVPFRCVAGG